MESLLNQSIGLENIEIILVDDASTDDGATLKRLEQYEQKFSDNIILIPLEENLRQGGARNVGIQYASGEYLMFCDADDYLSLCAAERLYNAAQIYQADVVEFRMKKVGDYDEIDPQLIMGDKSYQLDLSEPKVRRAVLDLSRDDFGLGCIPKFYRLSLIRDHDIRFAEHLIYEEPSFTVPVRLYENRHFYLDEVLYYYIQRPGSTMYARKTEHYLDSMKVWNILMDDLRERGLLEPYYRELSKMYYDWVFLLNLKILQEKGEKITEETFHELKNNVQERFPDIRENPLFDDEQGQKEIAVIDIGYTMEKQEQLRRMLDDCLQTG
jgi:glycosyltransferase involved in cell wall biosynthesis